MCRLSRKNVEHKQLIAFYSYGWNNLLGVFTFVVIWIMDYCVM